MRTASAKSVTIEPTARDIEGSGAPSIASAGESVVPASPTPQAEAEVKPISPAIRDFDDFIAEFVDPLVSSSESIDPIVEESVSHLVKALGGVKRFITLAAESKKPGETSQELMDLFQPISQGAESIGKIKESNRGSKYFFHLSALAEGVPALGWVVVSLPVPHVTDFIDAAQFYGNRIIKEYKESDKKQVDWVHQFIKLLGGLSMYVKNRFKTGIEWNSSGRSLKQVLEENASKDAPATAAATAAAAAAATGAPPPPPPPPPPPLPPASIFEDSHSAATGTSSGGMNAVFQDLNKGENVTSGLKKVDKSEMTHKNPSLRKTSSGGIDKKSIPAPPKKPASLQVTKKKPARTELEDTKWFIENYENEHEIVIHAEMNQGVFIDKCLNCTIQIKGKASAVSVNECSSIGLLIENLVSGVDIIKCKKFGLQVTGALPTLSIDQSTEGQVYLSKESTGVEIYTAQTSALNINVAKGDTDNGEYQELAIPEQMVHKIGTDGKIVSSIVEHDG